jgi:shikimate kinase
MEMEKTNNGQPSLTVSADRGTSIPQGRIFLAGFSGSGKTSIAPLLATHFGYALYDTDLEIERCRGVACTEIIEREGLSAFRILEKNLLLEIVTRRPAGCVIALGGGAVTIPEVIPLLRRNGLVVWLRIGVEEILARLGSCHDRPLLRSKSREEIDRFLLEREKFYRQSAHLTVEVSGDSLTSVMPKIIESIAGYRLETNLSGESFAD